MALGDSRRASGAASEAARRASGQANQDARRAIGARMEAERRGESLVEDLQRLNRPTPRRQALKPVAPVGALPAQRGRADYKAPPAATGGGIASPLTEPSYAAREWWGNGLASSDGLFFMPALKKVVLADADGAEVIINYAVPS